LNNGTGLSKGGIGTFNYSIDWCDVDPGKAGCETGASDPDLSQLVFFVTNAGGLSISEFDDTSNGKGNFFAVDLGHPCAGPDSTVVICTGNVAAPGSPVITHVPEPMTLGLFGAGLTGLAIMVRRRKATKAA
jgi:hypothetical protein